jgi:hypothetical protein
VIIANDLTGKKFNRLTVTGFSHKDKHGKRYWYCKCDCGGKSVVEGYKLDTGKTKSCGCYNKENLHKSKLKHGDNIRGLRKRLYVIWMNMLQRCNNEKSTSYQRYGKRGIRVCYEWHDYSAFRDWALSHGYNEKLTIDRIDNKGDYTPSNCRWVTPLEQSRNIKTNLIFEYEGKSMCLSEWCELLGLKYSRILYRVTHGYSFREAITRRE